MYTRRNKKKTRNLGGLRDFLFFSFKCRLQVEMEMFKSACVLKIGLPQPVVPVRWSELLTVDVRNDDDEPVVRMGRLWMSRLEDHTDVETLERTLSQMDDWLKYFGCGDRQTSSTTFEWTVDGRRYGSDNPYFELLMRTMRRMCVAFNSGESMRSNDVHGLLDNCLFELGIGRCVQVGNRPVFDHDVVVEGFVNADLLTALLALDTMRDLITDLAIRARQLIVDNVQQTKETEENFELSDGCTKSFLLEVGDHPSNPLKRWNQYEEYVRDLVTTVVRPLRLLTEVRERSWAFTDEMDVFQPSVWKRLRFNGITLPPCVSESTVLHEPDRERNDRLFRVFSGPVDNDMTGDTFAAEHLVGHERLRRWVMFDDNSDEVPMFRSKRTRVDRVFDIVDVDAENRCACILL